MKAATFGALIKGDLENAIIAETPGGIEAQEARGQRDFIATDTLPIECNSGIREQFEQMGIVFGKPVDDLFVGVQLPEGWRKKPTEHSMWSELLDTRGRVRATIFYKAAFYDRRASMNIVRRFSYRTQPVGGYESEDYDNKITAQVCVVTDCDNVIWQSEEMAPSDDIEWFRLSDHLAPLGKVWLNEHYPDWQDPLAYWED